MPPVDRYCSVCKTIRVILKMSVKRNLQTIYSLLGAPSGWSHGWGAQQFSGVSLGVSQDVSAWEDLTD